METNFKADLDKFLEEKISPINKNMLEQEKIKHERFLERHFQKYDTLAEKHDSYISHLTSLEGVIFGAIVIFMNPLQISIPLIIATSLLLVSLVFGIWRQRISIQSNYQTHEWNYYQELQHHWWSRELWKDSTVKSEKELLEPYLVKNDASYKKTCEYKILKLLHLDADKIENIFVVSFMLSLVFLIGYWLSKTPYLLK